MVTYFVQSDVYFLWKFGKSNEKFTHTAQYIRLMYSPLPIMTTTCIVYVYTCMKHTHTHRRYDILLARYLEENNYHIDATCIE